MLSWLHHAPCNRNVALFALWSLQQECDLIAPFSIMFLATGMSSWLHHSPCNRNMALVVLRPLQQEYGPGCIILCATELWSWLHHANCNWDVVLLSFFLLPLGLATVILYYALSHRPLNVLSLISPTGTFNGLRREGETGTDQKCFCLRHFQEECCSICTTFLATNGLVCIIFLAAGSCFYLHRVPCSWNVILLDSRFFKKTRVAFLSQGTWHTKQKGILPAFTRYSFHALAWS